MIEEKSNMLNRKVCKVMANNGIKNSMNIPNSIETEAIIIKGNIMTWGNTMIQLSNVSSISAIQESPKFPSGAIGFIVGGVLSATLFSWIEIFVFLGVLMAVLGVLMIVLYYMMISQNKYHLNVVMNSGSRYDFLVADRAFLNEMLSVLESIIIRGGVGENSISINIHDSSIGNFEALNDSFVRF